MKHVFFRRSLTTLCYFITVILASSAWAQNPTPGNLIVLQAAASATNTTASFIEVNPSLTGQTTPVQSITISGTGTNAIRISGSASSTGYLSRTNDGSFLTFTGANSTDNTSNVNTLNPRAVVTLNASRAVSIVTSYTGVSGNQTRSATSLNNTNWFIADQGGLYTNGSTSASPAGNFRGIKAFGGTVYVGQASTTVPPVSAISTPSGGSTTGLTGLTNGTANFQDFYLIQSGSNGSTYDILYIVSTATSPAGTIAKFSLVNGSWLANGTYTTTFGGFGLTAQRSGSGAKLYVTTGTGASTANSVIQLTDAAGYNASISITTANNLTLFTAATGTILKGIDFAPFSCPTITASLNGTTTICTGNSTNLTSTITGGTSPYSLTYSNGTTNTVVSNYTSGANIAVSPTASTTYTVVSVTDANACAATVSGTAMVTTNQNPTASNAGTPQTITSGNAATLAANTPTTGSGSWSVTSGPSTLTTQFSSTTNPAATFTPAGGVGTYVLTWTISNAPCSPSSSTVSVTVNAATPTCASGTLNVPGTYATIQAAVDAACTGALIQVAAGTYTEQLTLTKNVSIVGAGVGSTIIKAPAALAVGGPDEGAPYVKRNIVEIKGSSAVTMSGLTVAGTITGQDGCGTDAFGIYVYDNASLNLSNAAINDARLTDPSLFGCQVGFALGAGLTGSPASVTLTNVTMNGYQKGGILARGTGTTLLAQQVTVTGVGATTAIGQNGIQVSSGASASIVSSTIANNNYTPPAGDNTTSSGVITYNSGTVTISGSLFTGNDVGLDAEGTGTVATTNNTFTGNEYASIYTDQKPTIVNTGNTFDKKVTNNNQPGTLYTRIQTAVDEAKAGDVLTAAAGTYAENVTVGKSLTILGSNAGINPNTGSRVAETIVTPALNSADPDNGTSVVFQLANTSANVTLDGLTIDGDNPALSGGVSINGADINALAGVSGYGYDVSGLTLQNNIIKNFTGDGVDLGGGAATPSTHIFTANKFDNIAGQATTTGSGQAIYIGDNAYATITNNVMTRVIAGVQTGNFYRAALGGTPAISNNTISAYRVGIYHNLQYQAATAYTIQGNTLSADAGLSGVVPSSGLRLFSINNGVSATAQSNTVNAGFEYGVYVWNTPSTGTVSVTGGSVQGSLAGIRAINHNNFGDGAVKLTVSGVTITNSPVGVLVVDDPAAAANINTSVTVTGNTQISGTVAFTAVSLTGTDASANITGNAASFVGNGSGTGVDINGGTASLTANRITSFATGVNVSNGGQLTGAANNFITGNGTGVSYAANAGTTQGAVTNNDLSGNTGKAISNLTGTTLAATCNWYGTSNPTAGLFTGLVTYSPYLSNGTDNETGTPGFQPVPNSCVANTAPTVANAIVPQSATVGLAFSYAIPANTFTDTETPNALTITAGNLPGGLIFTAPNTISGTPTSTAGSPVQITVTATDPGSLSVSTTLTLTINANQAPVASTVNNQTATVGTAFSLTVPAFTDPENQTLTYAATGIPAPLTFDPATRIISGTPSTTGVSTITTTATDPTSNTSSVTFSLTVNSAPVVLAGQMRITEYMYSSNNGVGNGVGEYVELTNVGNAPIDLTGWSFDDNTRTAGSFSVGGFGIVQPNESVIITDATAAQFRTFWYLPTSVKVIGGNDQNLGRNDEINVYDATSTLVTRLTYNDQGTSPANTVRTQFLSAWPQRNLLGQTNTAGWQLSVANDAQNSYLATTGDLGNPGGYFTPLNRVKVVESAGNTAVTEGGVTDTYTVALNSLPTADVTVTINPGSQLTVGSTTLTFTPANFSTVQTVTVTAVDDAVYQGAPRLVTITQSATSPDVAYNGIAINPVSVTITDNDAAATSPPTIQVAGTTTAYLNLSANGPGYVSGVMGDPTDPASTQGINFTLADSDTDVNTLTATATSNNGNATVNLTGSGSSRNLKITPANVGYATITVAVNDGSNTVDYVINYAGSAASATQNTTSTRFHTGTSDASTAVLIDANYTLVGDDENQVLRLYNRQNSGLPVAGFDYTSSLGLTDLSGGIPREVDIEASIRQNNRIFWIGSQSNKELGPARPNRDRVFATDITGSGASTTLTYVGRYDYLKEDIVNWDVNNGHGKGANYYGLATSADAATNAKAPEGYNIEGAELAPDGTTAYIGFRAPQVLPASRTKALIVAVTNLTSLVNGSAKGSATFGAPIELDLGGRGIREIRKNAGNEYVIIAGPAGDAGAAPNDFRLYTWTGNAADAPVIRVTNPTLTSLNANGSFESIVEVPNPLTSTSQLQVLVDNGDAVYYNDGQIAKDLAQNNFKKFRSDIVTLGSPVNTAPTVANAIPPQSATVGVAFTYTIPANTFTDTETPGNLTLTITGLPTDLSYSNGVISGTPSTTVGSPFSVTVTATDPGSLSVSTTVAFTVQPAPVVIVVTSLSLTASANPTAILTTGTTTLSATVSGGTPPYSYSFSGPGTISASGNTATVSGLMAGVQTFTLTAKDATIPTNQTLSTTVSVTVTTPVPTNQAPFVANTIPPLSATVNQAFTFNIPANTFSDPNNDALTVAVIGLPQGLSFTAPATISGTPSMPGTSTITVTATDPGSLSASTSFALTVSASATQPTAPATLTITSFSCFSTNGALSSVNFVVGYSNGTFAPALPDLFINGITITGQLGQPYTFGFDANQSLLPIQDQATRSTYFVWNYRQACTSAPVTPPTPTAPVAPMLPNQTATQGTPFSYVVPAFTGTAPIVYTASGLPDGLSFDAGTRTISGTPITVQTPTVTISASNVAGMSSGTFSIAVSASATQPTAPATLTITSFSCFSTNGALSSVNFVVGYSNGTFAPALPDLFINGITITGQLGVQYGLSFDANQSLLPIQDQATRSTYFVWNYRQACTTSPSPVRLSAESVMPLQLQVLGNPVSEAVIIDVRGVEGQALLLQLIDANGTILEDRRIDRATAIEQQRFDVRRQSAGVILMRAVAGPQTQTVKILKK